MAIIFSDNFTRANSGSTGNGWVNGQAGSGSTWGISSNRAYMASTGSGTPYTNRNDIVQTSAISVILYFTLASATSNGYLRLCILGGSNGYTSQGYNLTIAYDATSNNVTIGDNGTTKATTSFTFNHTDNFAMQMDIYGGGKNWMDGYVWNQTSGSKPGSPNLSWHNSGSNYTPSSTGAYTGFTDGDQSSGTQFYTLFQVQDYPALTASGFFFAAAAQ